MQALERFAAEHDLAFDPAGRLRSATRSLAEAGTDGPVASGALADGLQGELALVGSASRARTVVLARVPEAQAYAPAIVCQDRQTSPRAQPIGYSLEAWDEVRQESEAFRERFRLLVLSAQDPGWAVELFSPSFIAWLADRAPQGITFELNDGWLSVLVPGHAADAGDLDAVCKAAATIADRIREEAAEEGDDPDLFDAAENTRRLEAQLAKVEWEQPPASVAEAAAAYRRRARWRPSVIGKALLYCPIIGVVAGLVGLLAIGIVGLPLGFVGGIVIAFPVLWQMAAQSHTFDGFGSAFLGMKAFDRGYAASRGLERQKLARFHHEHRDLPVPGKADCVMAGEIPRANMPGLFVFLADSPELSATASHAMGAADRPLSYDLLIAELGERADAESGRGLSVPEGWKLDVSGSGRVVVSRGLPGNLIRTAAGCDEFRERAGGLVAALASPAA